MAYGTPKSLEDVESYYSRIMGGKQLERTLVEKLKKRYAAIGGKSPLLEITESQARKLKAVLGDKIKVYYGMKYSSPYIEEAVKQAANDGIEELICVPLAPFYSKIGTGSYYRHVDAAISNLRYKGIIRRVDAWNMEEGLISAWYEKIREAGIEDADVMVFTAHSLPITEADDLSTYKKQLLQTSNSIQKRFGNKWSLSFQSAAEIEGNWIGPDVEKQIKDLKSNGVEKIMIIPVGFITDNLETIYDIGMVCRKLCSNIGVECKISGMPNDSERLIEALASTYHKTIRNDV